jgi:hypothetical protein
MTAAYVGCCALEVASPLVSARGMLRAHEAGHSMRRGLGLMLVGLINHRCFQG